MKNDRLIEQESGLCVSHLITDRGQSIINYSSIRKNLHYFMSKDKKRGVVFRNSKHSKDILADATYTIQKIQSMNPNQRKRRDTDFKKKMATSVKLIVGDRGEGKSHKSVKMFDSRLESPAHSFSQQFQKRLKTRKDLQMSKLNNRIEQLNKRILPGRIQEGQKLQKKLMEIIDIHNKNSKNDSQPTQFYSQHFSPNSHAKKKMLQETDYKQVQSQFWNRLSKESKLSKSTIDLIRSNRIDILIRRTIDTKEELNALNRLGSVVQRRTEKSLKTRHSQAYFNTVEDDQKHNNRYSAFQINQQQQQRPVRKATIYRNKELADWEMIRYLKQKQKRKKFINSISKDMIENQKAVKIYSLVKGGYPIDESQVQGQFISLTRFNQARSEFATLNWLYKSVQDDVTSKNIKNQQLKENNDSFKRLVQINELSEKIPRYHLQKIIKTSKIVI